MTHLFCLYFFGSGMKGRECMVGLSPAIRDRAAAGLQALCSLHAQDGALGLRRFSWALVTLSRARAFLNAADKSIGQVDYRNIPQLTKFASMMCVGLALCVGCTSAYPVKPDVAKAYYDRGIVKMVGEQDYPGAVESFSRAIQFNPDDPTNYVSRALAYKRIGELKKARKDMDHAISLNKELAPFLRLALE